MYLEKAEDFVLGNILPDTKIQKYKTKFKYTYMGFSIIYILYIDILLFHMGHKLYHIPIHDCKF